MNGCAPVFERQIAALAEAVEPVTMVVSRFLSIGEQVMYLVRPLSFSVAWASPLVNSCGARCRPSAESLAFRKHPPGSCGRDFLLQVPFTKGQRLLQDLDWLLRAYHHPQMRVLFLQEPLTIFHNDQGPPTGHKENRLAVLLPLGHEESASLHPQGPGIFYSSYLLHQIPPLSGHGPLVSACGSCSKPSGATAKLRPSFSGSASSTCWSIPRWAKWCLRASEPPCFTR